jgi:hypothetical protein
VVMRLLRHNSRHMLYYHPTYRERGGASIVLGWSLNPTGSMHDGRQRSLCEPLWAHRLRQRLFAFVGRQRCGRRGESWHGQTDVALPDTWDMGPDGSRTCSYCGSIHPDDLMRLCHLALTDERYEIQGTGKSYKFYVRQPGVRNAGDGAIKFYMAHAPASPSAEDKELFASAVRLSLERFRAKMDEWRK